MMQTITPKRYSDKQLYSTNLNELLKANKRPDHFFNQIVDKELEIGEIEYDLVSRNSYKEAKKGALKNEKLASFVLEVEEKLFEEIDSADPTPILEKNLAPLIGRHFLTLHVFFPIDDITCLSQPENDCFFGLKIKFLCILFFPLLL